MATVTDLVSGLNPQQREAVTAGEGPVLVLAGPGSGKTRVLTHRIAYLIRERDIYPYHIMAVTFTNKAAAEMRMRLENLLGGRPDGLQIGTFHAICARLLRREADHLPYRDDFAIYDTDDQQSLIKQSLNEANIDSKKYSPGRILNAISAQKNELITPEAYVGRDYFGEIVGRIYERYQALLLANNALDFDDLLMQTVLLLRNNDGVRERWQQRLQHILVDEFQDTNTAQYQLVQILALPQNNVFVVGDEDQGIYAFRGADYRNVLQFRKDYPDAHVILLEQNYRSTQIVLDAARAVIDKNKHRTPKALFTDRQGGPLVTIFEAYTEADEGQYIVGKVTELRRQGYNYRDISVMYRTNAQSRALEEAFIGKRVPYKLIGGVGFYKRREVRDLLAYMRLVNNPDDSVSFNRVVNVPARGIGKTSLEAFQQWAVGKGGTAQALEALARGEPSPITGRASKSLAAFGQMIDDWRVTLMKGDLIALFDAISSDVSYHLYIHEISDTDEQVAERLENLAELRALVLKNRELSLVDFLNETSLVSDVDSLDEHVDAVTLLTLHAAKGLEYNIVFIAGLEDGLLPHTRTFDDPDQMAEERRLFYVGLTRAKDHVYLTYAFRRMLYGDSLLGQPSRFIGDIPGALTEGVSAQVSNQRDRMSFQRQTSWESDTNWEPKGTPTRSANPKIIPFNGGSGARPASKSAARPPAPALKYHSGQKVRHAKFGEGTVIESKQSGNDEDVTVAFSGGIGIKTLAASFAHLTILP